MWKQMYHKVKTQQREERTISNEVDPRVRAVDGGFFEKLNELLQKHAENEKLRQSSSDVTVKDANSEVKDGEVPADSVETFPVPEASGTLPVLEDQEELISDAMGSNIEALYLEVLHMILHRVGSEATTEDTASLFSYAQAAFKFDDDTHNELLEQAKIMEAPNILLHVEVVEAKDLKPMDVNGLSDTFCIVYLTSNKNQQYSTSIKLSTLCPKWSEHFCLSVGNPSDDYLCIEGWDFDPAETVHEKIKKIGEVKGIKGWGKLVHEFAAAGKNENEFIGRSLLALKSIQTPGEIRWCDLEKEGKTGKRGSVKLKLMFSSEKNTQATFKAHRNLLRLLLLYHLESTKVEPYLWNGNLPVPADSILIQHLVHGGLTPVDDLLIKWIEYCGVHVDHPLSFEIFSALLSKLIKPIQNKMFENEKEMLFWDAAKKLMPSYVNGIRKLHTILTSDKNNHQLAALLRVISHLSCLKLPENFTLFPKSIYEWLTVPDNSNNCDFLMITKQAVTQGAQDWFNDITDNNIDVHESFTEERLNHLIKLVLHAVTDLQKAIQIHDKIFQENIHLEYALIFFAAHECKISEFVEPVIEEVYQLLKPLKFTSELSSDSSDSEVLTLGMQLFDLYLTLQKYVILGRGLPLRSDTKYKLLDYYLWFHRSVAQWLDISLYKALQRIKKAIELDNLIPVSSSVLRSSSAVDTIDIYYQIKAFWDKLSWPDAEGSYVFVTKIVDDICRCSVFYATVMSEKVERFEIGEKCSENNFNVTKEWCLAINNIEYIWNSIIPFISELGMDDIMKELIDTRSSTATEHCRQTLQLVIDNAVETVANKISELLETAAEKMMPTLKKVLLEGAELSRQENNNVDRLMQYLDNNLMILHSDLKSEVFQQILSIIWQKVAMILSEIVETSLEQKRPRVYYINLQKTLEILVDYFSGGDEQEKRNNSEALKEVKEVLSLHSMETSQLVHKFYIERLVEQNSIETSRCGIITIRIGFIENVLRIDILSCRNLQPMDKNGSCDPYVEITLLPPEQFIGIQKQKTKTHKKTLFPLFDETLVFQLTHEQSQSNEGMVLLTVKDQDFLGNEFVGEAFIPFTDIEKVEATNGLQELKQIHLKLSVPKNLGSPVSKALKLRDGDKLAKEFIKKQRSKAQALKEQ